MESIRPFQILPERALRREQQVLVNQAENIKPGSDKIAADKVSFTGISVSEAKSRKKQAALRFARLRDNHPQVNPGISLVQSVRDLRERSFDTD